jgi:importin-9
LTILKRYVLHSWSLSSERYEPNPQLDFLPQDQKAHIRKAVLDLVISPNHVIRDLSVNIVPKIAQADWPNDWPGFLEQLSNVFNHSKDVREIISVLKILRGCNFYTYSDIEFISETLTDDSYFSIVPPIIERLLAMQSDDSLLVRAKAQSVFRACVEQMEMYKDTSAYQATVEAYIDSVMGPWVTSLLQGVGVDLMSLSGENYDGAIKLTHAIYKVFSQLLLMSDHHIIG